MFLSISMHRGQRSFAGLGFNPHTLGRQMSFTGIEERRLNREKGAVAAMAMNPATDDSALIDLGLSNNTRRFLQSRGVLYKLVYGLLHTFGNVVNAMLLYQATMALQFSHADG
jgi:hypothetical protein